MKKPVILGNIKHTILDGKYNRLVDVIHDLRAIVWNIDYYLSVSILIIYYNESIGQLMFYDFYSKDGKT